MPNTLPTSISSLFVFLLKKYIPVPQFGHGTVQMCMFSSMSRLVEFRLTTCTYKVVHAELFYNFELGVN